MSLDSLVGIGAAVVGTAGIGIAILWPRKAVGWSFIALAVVMAGAYGIAVHYKIGDSDPHPSMSPPIVSRSATGQGYTTLPNTKTSDVSHLATSSIGHFSERPSDKITLIYGGRTFSVTRSQLKIGFGPNDSLDGKPPFIVYLDADNTPGIKLTIYDGISKSPRVAIDGHEFTLNHDEWDRNWNDNAFEIVNAQRIPMLQVIWRHIDTVEVSGVFMDKEGSVIDTLPRAAKPIFKYPNWKYHGQIVGDNDPPDLLPVSFQLSQLSNTQLRDAARDVSSELRALEGKYQSQIDWNKFEEAAKGLNSPDRSRLFMTVIEPTETAMISEFRQKLQPEAINLRSALWSRDPLVGDWRARWMIPGLDINSFAGPSPLSDIATQLEILANRINK